MKDLINQKKIEIDYDFSGSSNYLIINVPNGKDVINYQVQMISNNETEYFLNVRKVQVNNSVSLYYDLGNKATLSQLIKNEKLTKETLLKLILNILRALQEAEEFELELKGLVLDKRYIYMESLSAKPSFIYLPFYKENDNFQNLVGFIQNLKDEKRIEEDSDIYVTAIVNACKNEYTTIEDLKSLISNLNNNDNSSEEQDENIFYDKESDDFLQSNGDTSKEYENDSFEKKQPIRNIPVTKEETKKFLEEFYKDDEGDKTNYMEDFSMDAEPFELEMPIAPVEKKVIEPLNSKVKDDLLNLLTTSNQEEKNNIENKFQDEKEEDFSFLNNFLDAGQGKQMPNFGDTGKQNLGSQNNFDNSKVNTDDDFLGSLYGSPQENQNNNLGQNSNGIGEFNNYETEFIDVESDFMKEREKELSAYINSKGSDKKEKTNNKNRNFDGFDYEAKEDNKREASEKPKKKPGFFSREPKDDSKSSGFGKNKQESNIDNMFSNFGDGNQNQFNDRQTTRNNSKNNQQFDNGSNNRSSDSNPKGTAERTYQKETITNTEIIIIVVIELVMLFAIVFLAINGVFEKTNDAISINVANVGIVLAIWIFVQTTLYAMFLSKKTTKNSSDGGFNKEKSKKEPKVREVREPKEKAPKPAKVPRGTKAKQEPEQSKDGNFVRPGKEIKNRGNQNQKGFGKSQSPNSDGSIYGSFDGNSNGSLDGQFGNSTGFDNSSNNKPNFERQGNNTGNGSSNSKDFNRANLNMNSDFPNNDLFGSFENNNLNNEKDLFSDLKQQNNFDSQNSKTDKESNFIKDEVKPINFSESKQVFKDENFAKPEPKVKEDNRPLPQKINTDILNTEVEIEDTVFVSNKKMPFLVYEQDGIGQKIYITKPSFIIGRYIGKVDYVCQSNKVGKIHAEIISRDGLFFINDFNSKNGTYINSYRQRIISNIDYPIDDGDVIILADVEFIFHEN